MKYLLLKSKETIKFDINKYIYIYYLLTILYFFINKNIFISGNMSIDYCLGLRPIMECNSIEAILKIILIALIIFLTYKIYSYDIMQNVENIYMRSNSKKILIINIFIILSFITISRLVLLFVINIFIKINFNTIFLDLSYCYFISITSILMLNLIVKKCYLYKLLLIIIIIALMFFSLVLTNIVCLIIFSFIFLVLTFFSYSLQSLTDFFK